MAKSVYAEDICNNIKLTIGRIFENQHLLDATEIFRKLNVHKKVSRSIQQLRRAAFRNDVETSIG